MYNADQLMTSLVQPSLLLGRIAVIRTVSLSVCRTSEPCKMAAPIEIPFGLYARMGCRNHVLDYGSAVLRDVAMANIFGIL